MFDLVAGFCHSQILMALVKFDIPAQLLNHDASVTQLAHRAKVPVERMKVLLDGGVALGLLRYRREQYGLSRRGAALAGVPGLQGMIRHHDVLYRDLSDPVAFFRGEVETELADFWPYVFGAGAARDPETARVYSDLMSDSQGLVAADTLSMVDLSGTRRLMDVGGGTGAFLAAVARTYPKIDLHLFDLPAVAPAARHRFDGMQESHRLTITPGSFRDDALPAGADIITLVRVLYDHADDTVMALLKSVFRSLPTGGRLIVSEPMTGNRAGDAYFALYCMAMRTGRARSASEIASLASAAGFDRIVIPRAPRPFVTSVVECVKSS